MACAAISSAFAPGSGNDGNGNVEIMEAPPDSAPGQQDGKDKGVSWLGIGKDDTEWRKELLDLARFVEDKGLEPREVETRLLEILPAGLTCIDETVILFSLAMEALVKCRPMPSRVDSLLCKAWLAMQHSNSLHESGKHPHTKGTEEAGTRGCTLCNGFRHLFGILPI